MNEDKEKKEINKRFYLSIVSLIVSSLGLIIAIVVLVFKLVQ